MEMTRRCPQCSMPVIYTYCDTGGQHWRCPSCGATDFVYTMVTYSTTATEKRPYGYPATDVVTTDLSSKSE